MEELIVGLIAEDVARAEEALERINERLVVSPRRGKPTAVDDLATTLEMTPLERLNGIAALTNEWSDDQWGDLTVAQQMRIVRVSDNLHELLSDLAKQTETPHRRKA